ncbi:1-acyl-sn-glycerol-3-phosphate acyltransferase [Nocardioidaceae bacterium]|nr:1-acyl-sn-glycerol-3-phosphate acyltransferase [Nocardioidaceae bacterium]
MSHEQAARGPLALLARSVIAGSAGEYVRRWHRHDVALDAAMPGEPCLVVANHGFGGVFDLNVLALLRTLTELDEADRTTFLVHDLAWTLRVGPVLERLGCAPGSRESVAEAFGAGRHVAVFPGGDVEAAKPVGERHRIKLDGRDGFAQVAVDHGVPVVPVVTAGAGESLLVLSDGRRLAAALDLPRRLRMETLPVTLSVPWGLNVGLVGLLPYLPLPTKLSTAVLPPMRPHEHESVSMFASRVGVTMQARLDELTAARRPVLG